MTTKKSYKYLITATSLITFLGCPNSYAQTISTPIEKNIDSQIHNKRIQKLKIKTASELENFNALSGNWEKSLKIYKAILFLRIKTNYRGYENKTEFKDDAMSLLNFLNSIEEPNSKKTNDPVIKNGFNSVSRISYRSHINSFLNFYRLHASKDSFLNTISPQEAINATLAVSYQTYKQNPKYWNRGWRFTGFYPWCKPPAPFDDIEFRN